MKTILMIFILFLCHQTFAQQINKNDGAELPSLIMLQYPNIKDAFLSKNNVKNDSLTLLNIKYKENPSFYIDYSRRANRNFAFLQPNQIDLSKELKKITHKFPGDGNNLDLGARGLLVP